MKWKLLFLLSISGLAIAFATCFVLPGKYEFAAWTPVLLFNVFIIVKKCDGKYFLNGFVLSLINCVWVTGIHLAMIDRVLVLNPEMVQMAQGTRFAEHPRQLGLIMGPVIGIVFGIVQGGLAWIASKFMKKK